MDSMADLLKEIVGGKPNAANVNSVAVALTSYGAKFGLDKPHRLAHFIAQVAHESGAFKYDNEIWGPTAAQKGYEGRKDLGNTQRGDGKKFLGRGPIQLTGRANVTKFYEWCKAQGLNPPNFADRPDMINTDPWEGLSAIWFWEVGNQTKKSLSRYADSNDPENLTRKINGGLNGYEDRLRYYTRAALVLLGYGPTDVRAFQRKAKLTVDGSAGPLTRSALHMALVAETPEEERPAATQAAPVTEKVAVDATVAGNATAAGGVGVGGALGGIGVLLQGLQESLTPFSSASNWINTLVVILIVAGAVIAIAGIAYRLWASRKKAATLATASATMNPAPPK